MLDGHFKFRGCVWSFFTPFTLAGQVYYTYFRKFLPTAWAHDSVYCRDVDSLEHETRHESSF